MDLNIENIDENRFAMAHNYELNGDLMADPDVEFIRSDQDEIKASIETNLRETVIYYENDSGQLVPIKRDIVWEEGIGKSVLKSMVDSVAVREEIERIRLEKISKIELANIALEKLIFQLILKINNK